MNKHQQMRIAASMAGLSAPPKGAAMVRQQDQAPRSHKSGSDAPEPARRDMIHPPQAEGKSLRHDRIAGSNGTLIHERDPSPRHDLVTTDQLARKRAAASSVHTSSGGGAGAPAAGDAKGSLRDEIRSAMTR